MNIRSFISRLMAGGPERPAPPGHAIYAVGDIHGRADLLEELIGRIDADAPDGAEIVFLGDYIDRGPNSAVVLDMVIDLKRRRDLVTCLKGNHEAVMLDFLEDASAGPAWARFGGLETLMAYGIDPPRTADPDEWEAARLALGQVLPSIHCEFLNDLKSHAERGCYFFAHAGVNPERALAAQTENDLLWIREPFLNSEHKLERIIVHGHSPTPEAHHDDRRIGVDTGAYATGVLTAARLSGGAVDFIATGQGG